MISHERKVHGQKELQRRTGVRPLSSISSVHPHCFAMTLGDGSGDAPLRSLLFFFPHFSASTLHRILLSQIQLSRSYSSFFVLLSFSLILDDSRNIPSPKVSLPRPQGAEAPKLRTFF